MIVGEVVKPSCRFGDGHGARVAREFPDPVVVPVAACC
jgi:hypothetical protein